MRTRPIEIITVSRQYGAGGSEFAAALGARLGWPVLDQELVPRVAARLGLHPDAVARLDEHPPTLIARFAAACLVSAPELPASIDAGEVLQPDAVAEAVHAAIVEGAGRPPLIVVGHGGQSIFRGKGSALHVRLVAPVDSRARRIAARLGCSAAEAERKAPRVDADRMAYIRRYYGTDWSDPLLYDVQLNTARVTIAEAVASVERLVAGRAAAVAAPA